jgi:hypothetical protein
MVFRSAASIRWTASSCKPGIRDDRRLLLDRPSPPPCCNLIRRYASVLMQGIKAGISHRFTRAVLMTCRFDGSPPRRIGATLTPVTVNLLERQKRPFSWRFDRDGYPSQLPANYRANRPLPGWDLHPRGDRAPSGTHRSDKVPVNTAIVRDIALTGLLSTVRPTARFMNGRKKASWNVGHLETVPQGDA